MASGDDRVAALMEISNAMVHLYKNPFGRGPTSARSHWAGGDVLVCVLENTLTPAERSLVALGEHKLVRDTRIVFQYASIRGFCDPVERITGRRVRAFHSSIDTMVDGMALEVFVMYPNGHPGPSRAELSET